MGTLNEFIAYLDERGQVVTDLESRMCDLQSRYEAYFGELTRVREHELGQLSAEVVARRDALPGELTRLVNQSEKMARAELNRTLADLEARYHILQEEAETMRQESLVETRKIRERNTTLDRAEEELKERNTALLAEIAEHNRRIRELGGGFGFFANFFRMRSLHKQAAELKEKEADVAARIESLRGRWVKAEANHEYSEAQLQEQWAETRGKADALLTKIDYLRTSRERIVLRSVMEEVLDAQETTPHAAKEGDPPCPRCKSPNPETNHFCAICAQRLVQDRPDLEGSIAEVAEVNFHFDRFSEGMKACQEIIGLLRGINSGIVAFCKSVADVLATQQRHSLSTLNLNVPASSVEYGKSLDQVGAAMQWDFSVHPKVFASNVKIMVEDVFTEDKIQAFFEAMGEELSAQADSQW